MCTLCCPSSSWITEAKPHNNRIKQMCYPSKQNQHLKQLQDETQSYTSLLQPAGLPHASKVIKISLIKENTLHMSKSQGTRSSTALLCSLSGFGWVDGAWICHTRTAPAAAVRLQYNPWTGSIPPSTPAVNPGSKSTLFHKQTFPQDCSYCFWGTTQSSDKFSH